MKVSIRYDFPKPDVAAQAQECAIAASTPSGDMPNPMFFIAVMFATANLLSSKIECKCDSCVAATKLCEEVMPRLASLMGNCTVMEDTIGPTVGRA